MSLISLKKRPFKRDVGRFRDDRLFIIACDDTYAPQQYFAFFEIPRVQVHVVVTEDGTSSARHVLERLLAIEHESDDELWILLDTDHYTKREHLATFTGALSTAKSRGVNVALSKPCFEIWLLLHYVDESLVKLLTSARTVESTLRERLPGYNKRRLRRQDYPLAAMAEAYRRAEKLDGTVLGGDIPQGNTSRVFLLWRAIVAKALRSQLPPELYDLLSDPTTASRD